MGRYKNATILNAEIEEQNHQTKLRQKHNINNANVVVVEKSNTFKFIVRVLILIIKVAAGTALITLAAIGIYTLAEPELRALFIQFLNQIISRI
jgi:hypothetical protein